MDQLTFRVQGKGRKILPRILPFIAPEYTHLGNEYEIFICDVKVSAYFYWNFFTSELMNILRSIMAVLLLVLCQPVFAAVVSDLYRSKVSISQQAAVPSEAQISQGLADVLIKVSGNLQITQDAQIQQQLLAPASTLKQFSYTQDSSSSYLLLDYHPAMVDALIARTGKKPQGVQRPTVLIWFAATAEGGQDYLQAQDPLYLALIKVAKQRGLPLQFPLLDLQDQIALPLTSLWGRFAQPVEQASLRYKADAIIAGRVLSTADGSRSVEWRLAHQGKSLPYADSGSSAELAEKIIHRVADQLFNPVVSHNLSYFQTGIAVQVEGVSSLADYIQLLDFFKSLPLVSQVKPEQAVGNQVTLRLQLDGSESQLREAISLEPRLKVLDGQRDQQGTAIFMYRWQG